MAKEFVESNRLNNMILTRISHWAEKVIFPLNKYLNYIGMVLVFAMMLLTVVDVVGRKFVGIIPGFQPVPGSYELTEFILVGLVYSALGYAQIKGDHISIDVLTSRFPKRAQNILDTVVYLVSAAMAVVVSWRGFAHGRRLIEQGDHTAVLHIPVYPFLFLIGVGMLIFALALLFSSLQSLAKAVNNES